MSQAAVGIPYDTFDNPLLMKVGKRFYSVSKDKSQG